MSKTGINHGIKTANPMRSEKEQIAIGLKRWGHVAYRKSLSKGVPAVVLKGNKIYRVSSNASDVVSEVSQAKYKITQRSFDLSK